MKRHNDGMIYTNDRCVACNRCVHICPAVGANVTANEDGRISVDVSDKNCVHCGKCIKECVHDARVYRDSFGDLLADLKKGVKVSVIVDPSFLVAYGEKRSREVFGFLRSLGIEAIYDGTIGGDISLYCHIHFLRESTDSEGLSEKFLAHTCPGFSNYLSRYAPEALKKFIPVQLPGVCAAIYYRKYKNVNGRFALLSPCTAIYDEIVSFCSGRNVNYLIGFSSLLRYMDGKDLSGLDSWFEYECGDMGRAICENDAFTFIVSRYFSPKHLFKTSSGIDSKLEKLFRSPDRGPVGLHPTMVENEFCRTGCIDGPAIDRRFTGIERSIPEYLKKYEESMAKEDDGELSPDERYLRLKEKYGYLNTLDFEWEGDENYHQMSTVPDNVVEEIYTAMHKTDDSKKTINCQACGYKSCYEMVCAVAKGYSRIEDCVHYLNDELKNQLGLDHLTGLYNQRGFFRNSTRLIADNPDKKYILAIGDINGLGGINDLYSNTGGDLVISYVAKTLEEFCDKRGVSARMGGGTFGCLFENTPGTVEDFKNATQLSAAHLGIEYPLSIKFGFYELNDLSTTMGRAVLYATYAYRMSKDRSKNTYTFYTDKMSESMSAEAEVTQKMKSAMENNEFVLFMQPKFDHITHEMVGAEVLSRWIKADGSIVSPGVFIPVFEKNGYITELDRHVWKRSFETVTEWIEKGIKPVPVSVNISRISLLDDGIIQYILSLKEQYPKAVRYIQFEITESAYVGNTDEIFERVERIRDMGFKVNMDDFGSGYSSLNLLKDAPIDIVKLDMGFLRGQTNMDRGTVIISAVVNMTRTLGFDIIAEGVETKEQADMLTGMGCNIIQGFLYSKPVPEIEFSARLERAL